MVVELVFRSDGVLVRTRVRNPLTGKESVHEELVEYSFLPSSLNMLGIRDVKPEKTDKGMQIRFTVENFSMEKLSPQLAGLRKGTRIERIASVLMARKGEAHTTKELGKALKENDLPNIQWEATRLVRQQRGFDTVMKEGRKAYLYSGS